MHYTKLDKIRIFDRTRRCLLEHHRDLTQKGDRKGAKQTAHALVALAKLLDIVLNS